MELSGGGRSRLGGPQRRILGSLGEEASSGESERPRDREAFRSG